MTAPTSSAAAFRAAAREVEADWSLGRCEVIVGKDVLELLSSAMYVDPITVYREYVQNAADAVDEARRTGLLRGDQPGRVDIAIDPVARLVWGPASANRYSPNG